MGHHDSSLLSKTEFFIRPKPLSTTGRGARRTKQTVIAANRHREERCDVAISWRTGFRSQRDCFVTSFLAPISRPASSVRATAARIRKRSRFAYNTSSPRSRTRFLVCKSCEWYRAHAPIGFKRNPYRSRIAPWWLCHPRETLVPRRVRFDELELNKVACPGCRAPTSAWLAAQAIPIR